MALIQARRALLESLAAPLGEMLGAYGGQYGSGVYPASGGAEQYFGNLMNRYWDGSTFKGTTIWPRFLGTPSDSPALRFQDADSAVEQAQDSLDELVERYSRVGGEPFSAVAKVLSGLTSQGLVPNDTRWEKSRLVFELYFLDQAGVAREVRGVIRVRRTGADFSLSGELRLRDEPARVSDTPLAAPGQIRVGSGKNP